ncbi:hypothetical protein FHW12_003168 [Dokdonella fugitiva]|uniref:Uncharacterized protein n=1 Tax=Dokdonella fugitiva TaxID=328517 RepID=A0A839F4G7_9GAMM|nr:hypothetical protein [Dokdonella fugitiva]MBA8888932.1 hypothetical protein [Dokdonella fugitiva]
MATYNLDLDVLNALFQERVRRVAMMIGLVHNIRDNELVVRYQLGASPVGVELSHLPPTQSPEEIKLARHGLAVWVLACALRDLVESFERILEPVYYFGTFGRSRLNEIPFEDVEPMREKFEKGGLDLKIVRLRKHLGIDVQYAEEFASLNKVRNCLTHRSGIVQKWDCDNSDCPHLTARWLGFDPKVEWPDGRRELVVPGMVVEGGPTLLVEVVQRTKRFDLGASLYFEAHELSELLFMFSQASMGFVHAAGPSLKKFASNEQSAANEVVKEFIRAP